MGCLTPAKTIISRFWNHSLLVNHLLINQHTSYGARHLATTTLVQWPNWKPTTGYATSAPLPGVVMMSDRSNLMWGARQLPWWTCCSKSNQSGSVTLTCSFRLTTMVNPSYSLRPRSSSVLSLEESHGQNSGAFLQWQEETGESHLTIWRWLFRMACSCHVLRRAPSPLLCSLKDERRMCVTSLTFHQ